MSLVKLIYGWVTLRDSSGVEVGTASNRLQVSTPPPAPPPGTTPVIEPPSPLIDLQGGLTNLQTYVIPAGKTLTIQRLLMSGENRAAESKVTLYYAPNGVIDGTEVIISMGHLSGFVVAPQDLNDTYVGDGVAAIILERRRLDNGRREIFAKWFGYLV
jgi:hypothetical protein